MSKTIVYLASVLHLTKLGQNGDLLFMVLVSSAVKLHTILYFA